MKVSGREVSEAILKKLEARIKKENISPALAIILANKTDASRLYVGNKIKAAQRVGIDARLFEFEESQKDECLEKIRELNQDTSVNGIIIQYPVHQNWNFDEFERSIVPEKDVDGFLEKSPFSGATARAVWEMLTAFSKLEGFSKTADFLQNKNIVVLGRGKTAGGPTIKLLEKKGFKPEVVTHDTKNPNQIIKSADVIISATGVKNIINKNNLKKDAYVIGVGVGKEVIEGKVKIYGDINDEEVSQIAKLYCPTIGGIGPLTIVSLLKNVVKSSLRRKELSDGGS